MSSQARLHQRSAETQQFGTVTQLPIALAYDTRMYSSQRPPDGIEDVPAMLSRLLEAHEIILGETRDAAARVAELGDDGTADVLVSQVIRTGETQVWFLAEHLVAPQADQR